jgi:hypothetical protein
MLCNNLILPKKEDKVLVVQSVETLDSLIMEKKIGNIITTDIKHVLDLLLTKA